MNNATEHNVVAGWTECENKTMDPAGPDSSLVEECSDTSVYDQISRGPRNCGADYLQQSGFARSIAPNNPNRLTAEYIKTDVSKRPKLAIEFSPSTPQHLLETVLRAIEDRITLTQVTRADGDLR